MKKLILFALLSLFLLVIFAHEAVFKEEDYEVKTIYNDSSCPGDAIFVRLNFTRPNKKGKITQSDFDNVNATLFLFADGQKCRESDFFTLSNTEESKTLLSGIPLSSWWTPETKLALKVAYTTDGKKKKEIDLPFKLISKTFVSETLNLDDRNSSIKNDISQKRLNEINKLNSILGEVNETSVYQTTPFIPPTKATRRTSFFADRREYKYTSGKSSTELHLGIDYGVPEGSTVSACADGKVVIAETRVSTGWSVVVEHLPGLYSLYYHMSRIDVKEGDIVKAGQLLGLSGSTGLATGPHLHWEIRLNSEAVNPDFFTGDFAFSESK